jgi:hypothetical protein
VISLLPYEDRGTERENEVHNGPSEAAVKKAVRERDGYKCRDCGMTQEEHKAKHEQALEVHRLIPGIVYHPDTCVTLCLDCHNKKPRKIPAALWCKDLRWAILNLYDERDAALYRALRAEMDRTSTDFGEVIRAMLEDKIAAVIEHDRADVTLTADGLW